MPQVSTLDRQNLRRAALEYGILENHPATVKDCIDDGVDVNTITSVSGVRPLHLALEMSNVSAVELLLEGGADIEEGSNGSTDLITASRYGNLECVELLVKHGAKLYARRTRVRTRFNERESFGARASAGAGAANGETCLHAALTKRHYPIVEYLLRREALERRVGPGYDLCLLQHLILTDDAASISNLKNCKLDLNDPCPDGTMTVFFALQHRKNNSLKGLLQAGANPTIRNAGRNSALQEAVREENADAVKYLIEYGANAHRNDKGDWSPIRSAILSHSLSMVSFLLDCGAGIEQDLEYGTTPLLAACASGFLEGVQLLVERGANLKVRNGYGQTCLLAVVWSKDDSIVDYLLDQDVCEVNGIWKGLSALHRAVLLNNADITSKLIRKQADVNAQNHNGEVPVFTAARRNALNLMCMLLNAGADPNISTKDGDFALHEAVKQGNVVAVKMLLHYGADRTRRDKNGFTPVQVAVGLVPLPQDIIQCLLTYNADNPNRGASHLARDNVEDKKIFDSEAEESLCCPITFEIMKDPVIAMDGHTYERKAIEDWIRNKKESPVTRQPITSATLIPNLAIRHLIEHFGNLDSNR